MSSRTERFTIPWGHAGIDATVRHMRALARLQARRPVVRSTVAAIGSRARSDAELAGDIRRWLDRYVRFVRDPPGVELIRTPELMLAEVRCYGGSQGDCDDVAVLGAALGMAAGLDAAYVLLGFTESEPFEHVYTELETASGPVELDTTRPAQMPEGLEVIRSERRRV